MKLAVVAFVAVVCLCLMATYVHCKGCGDKGDSCERSNYPFCCEGLNCIPPPRTCGGECNGYSCSDSKGDNRGLGEICENSNQCDNLPCKPPPRTCGGICAACVTTTKTTTTTTTTPP